MNKNSSGKVMTIFLIIIAVLLVSLTAISLFFFQKESELRQAAESKLNKSMEEIVKFSQEIEKLKKQNFLLDEKNKEADEKINNLFDELELQEGLREEIKKENISLREQIEKAEDEKDKAAKELSRVLMDSKKLTAELESKLKAVISEKEELEKKFLNAVEPADLLKQQMDKAVIQDINLPAVQNEVELEKIIVEKPREIPEGRVLSIDTETEFVIISIGEKDNVRQGDILSVYRGNDYLGDIKVTRLQPEMSAADFIPPFSSRRVRKNDQVIFKK